MPLSNIAKLLKRAADFVGGFLYIALFVTFVVQVTARFGFNQPIMWTDELAVILYIWVVLWGAAFMVPENEQVRFGLVYDLVPPTVQKLMVIAGHLLIGGLAIWGLPASWSYISFMAREGTPVLGWPIMYVFLPFALLLVSLAVRAVWTIAVTIGRFNKTEVTQ
jgi:TRAP-type C4-dicarboxylate transport system permease small subunit